MTHEVVDDWRHLRTYRIPSALPRQLPPALAEPERPVRWKANLYVCGDHRDNASIQGAMVSGRRAAETVIEDLS
jgi:predicted NAD/FAD-dependent oxidoreductase